jgi:hypothetical protein
MKTSDFHSAVLLVILICAAEGQTINASLMLSITLRHPFKTDLNFVSAGRMRFRSARAG